MPNLYPSPPGEDQRGFPTRCGGVAAPFALLPTPLPVCYLPINVKVILFFLETTQVWKEREKAEVLRGYSSHSPCGVYPPPPTPRERARRTLPASREARAGGAQAEGCASRASPRARPEAHFRVLPDGVGRSLGIPRHSSRACAPLATYLSQPPRSSCCPGCGARPGARHL